MHRERTYCPLLGRPAEILVGRSGPGGGGGCRICVDVGRGCTGGVCPVCSVPPEVIRGELSRLRARMA
jgi:hypothetical protein